MFGEVLKKIVDESDISLAKLSRSSGVSRSMLYKVIKGESGLSQEKFTQLVNTELFNANQVTDLMDAYLLSSNSARDGKGVIRALNFIENLQRNQSRKVSEHVEPVKTEGYQMLYGKENIGNMLSSALANYQKEILILNQEKSRVEKHIPETGKNIIILKNISDLSKKVTNLNDGLLACLRNPDLELYYTTVPTLNISIYDNYILVDDVLYMYDSGLGSMAYTSNKRRIRFFKGIFLERLESANRYFKLEPLFKNYQEVLKIDDRQSIIFKDQHYYIKTGSRVISLDKMLEDDLSDYFAKGVQDVKIHKKTARTD